MNSLTRMFRETKTVTSSFSKEKSISKFHATLQVNIQWLLGASKIKETLPKGLYSTNTRIQGFVWNKTLIESSSTISRECISAPMEFSNKIGPTSIWDQPWSAMRRLSVSRNFYFALWQRVRVNVWS